MTALQNLSFMGSRKLSCMFRGRVSETAASATVGRATCPSVAPTPYNGCGPGTWMARKTNGLATSASDQCALRVDERG